MVLACVTRELVCNQSTRSSPLQTTLKIMIIIIMTECGDIIHTIEYGHNVFLCCICRYFIAIRSTPVRHPQPAASRSKSPLTPPLLYYKKEIVS